MKVICSVYDAKAEYFFDIFVSRTRGEASRHFMSSVRDERNGMLFNHPEDYTLFCLGEYDERTGGIVPLAAPEAIVNGLVLVEKDEDEARQLQLAAGKEQ